VSGKEEYVFERQHYEKIAETLKHAPTLSDFVEKIIEVFKLDNPRFDETRFRKACGRKL
jgi:hypothetical protein